MSVHYLPSEEGRRRYPQTRGYFIFTVSHWNNGKSTRFACSCKSNCISGCCGECGCRACAWKTIQLQQLNLAELIRAPRRDIPPPKPVLTLASTSSALPLA